MINKILILTVLAVLAVGVELLEKKLQDIYQITLYKNTFTSGNKPIYQVINKIIENLF